MTILEEAQEIVEGPRRTAYGSPYLDHTAVGFVWAGILSKWTGTTVAPIPAHVVSMLMIGVKVIREAGKHGHDNLVDIAGYAYCASLEVEEEILREGTPWGMVSAEMVDLGPKATPEDVARVREHVEGVQTRETGVPPRSDRSSGPVGNVTNVCDDVSHPIGAHPHGSVRYVREIDSWRNHPGSPGAAQR